MKKSLRAVSEESLQMETQAHKTYLYAKVHFENN